MEHVRGITVSTGRVRQLVIAVGLVGALAFAALNGTAIGQAPAVPYPKQELYKPTPVPDRTILTPSGDPATQQGVSWRTDATVTTPQAQVAKTGGGPAFKNSATTIVASSSEPVVGTLGYPAYFHTATFSDLKPETDYLYRVGDGTNWSEWFAFTTASDQDKPFSFIYYGDAQNDIREHVSRVFRRAFTDRPRASLLVHAGDLVNTAANDDEWGEWFHAAGFINGMVNTIATPGNHEYTGTLLAPYWRPQFDWPDNGPQGTSAAHTALEGTVFHVDYQDVRFISLNSNLAAMADPAGKAQFLEVQATWLRKVLADNPNRWTVVTFHHPVWSNSAGRNNPDIRAAWLPIFEEFNVDLVLQGHDHTYGRGRRAVDPTRPSEAGDGPIYVVSVSGPKMYEPSTQNWSENGGEVRKQARDTQLYQLVDVTRSAIRYEARTATGHLFDGFVIHKDDAGRKTVVEDEEAQ